MSRKDALLRLHQRLLAKREALRRTLADEMGMSEPGKSGGGDVGDEANDGVQAELHSQLAALESRELRQIERAIELIREGNYGKCEGCGSSIPIARLTALPYSLQCVACAQRLEERRAQGLEDDADWESAYEFEGRFNERDISIGDIDVDFS
ncbi:MAG: TraR/DksA C4-type zinc finger protein [Planctomycetaceae bacterium]|jgi:DnaK suppressor protein